LRLLRVRLFAPEEEAAGATEVAVKSREDVTEDAIWTIGSVAAAAISHPN
jgi:hypothetical protein